MNESVQEIKKFLQYVALQFVNHPEQAELRMAELPDKTIRFRLILEQSDVAIMIGTNGMTISAIRSLMKAMGEKLSIKTNLKVVSHEEFEAEQAQLSSGN